MLLTAILIEIIGIATIGVGVGLELACGGEAYLVVVTVGSLMVATGGIIWGKFLKRKQ